MYLPRSLISHLYLHLLRTQHPLAPPVLILVSLDPDALCACRILTSLFKRDYIPHTIKPISGYEDLRRAGKELVRPMRTTDGGSGGVVICLGVGGLVDLEDFMGLEVDEDGNGGMGGVDIWIFDARRPWNLSNVFGIQSRASELSDTLALKTNGIEQGKISQSFQPGRGGIIVFDDGDIEEELGAERNAYCALAEMPELGDDSGSEGSDSEQDDSDDDAEIRSKKRKSDDEETESEDLEESTGRKRRRHSELALSDEENESEPDEGTPNKRRRSNSSSAIPSTPERPGRRGLLIMSNQNAQAPTSPQVSSSLPAAPSVSHQPSARKLRRQLLRIRRKHDTVLQKYYMLGASYSEPISSLLWNLASDLGRDDNDLLWYAIVGVSSLELSGRTSSGVGLSPLSSTGGSSGWNKDRGERIRSIFRDEVRRLNPTDLKDIVREANGDSGGIIQTHAKSPSDTSIRLSPEPRFLLIRHWSLYDSMLHSPYLSAKLHIWSDSGKRKLHKLLAKMGISLSQSKQTYTHMDMDIKRGLRQKLLKYAPMYGLEGLVPREANHGAREGWGFVRCWGWKACLSAIDVGTVIGAILEVGDMDPKTHASEVARMMAANTNHSGANTPRNQDGSANVVVTVLPPDDSIREESMLKRFWTAYDSLSDISTLALHIPTAMHLHRAILRTGTSIIEKRQIRHLSAFRMAIVKEGPDVQLFTHPGALIKLALWIAEAVTEMESSKGRKGGEIVMAGLDEERGVYVIVGLGGGAAVAAAKEKVARKAERLKEREKQKEEKRAAKQRKRQLHRERLDALGEGSDMEDYEDESESEDDSESDESSDDDDEAEEKAGRGKGLNRFGNAFQEVIEETGARVKVDSFEHCVVEVRKEDLSSFLETLAQKAVVG